MNKEIFIRELEKKIKRLPQEEIQNIITYYNDYFADADKSEEEVIKELGNPSTIASQILSDYAFSNDIEKPKKDIGTNKIMLAILAVFAAPIALPIGIAIIALIFALVVVIGALIFSFITVSVAFAVAGIASFIAGIIVLFQGPATGVFYIGIGSIFIGLGLLVVEGVRRLVPKVRFFIGGIIKRFLDKVNKRGRI